MKKKVNTLRKTTLINFKASPSFKARVDEVARLEGKKVSVLMREAIETRIRYTELMTGKRKMEPDI